MTTRRTVNDTGTWQHGEPGRIRACFRSVMDLLRYWVPSSHVRRFRFDLSATLGREPNGFDPGAGFFDALRQDPIRSGVKLIASHGRWALVATSRESSARYPRNGTTGSATACAVSA